MTDMNQQQPVNYMLLTWDRHIMSVAGLNVFVSAQPFPLIWDSDITAPLKISGKLKVISFVDLECIQEKDCPYKVALNLTPPFQYP